MSDAWQMVTCTRCHRTYRCTPADDFIQPVPDLGWTAGKVCERCLLDLAGIKEIQTIEVQTIEWPQ